MLAKIFFIILYYSFYLLFVFIAILIWQLYKHRKRPVEIIFLLVILTILVWGRFIEPNYIKTRNYNFDPNKTEIVGEENNNNTPENREIKVAVFSDLHLGVFNNNLILKKLVKKINKIEPDLVIIPGDFIYFINRDKLRENFYPLSEIKATKIAVLGNHDYGKRKNDFSRDIISTLESLGVLIVDNKVKNLNINNSLIEIVGLADLWVGSPDYEILRKDDYDQAIDLRLLVTHNPDSIYEILDFKESLQINFQELESLREIDLIISGHTHAGQIRVPFLYKHIIPTKHDHDRGFYNISDLNMFVTPGIGNVVLPMRLFNFPELSIININY